jgi:maltooligosyltrehalose trehalohydrolase
MAAAAGGWFVADVLDAHAGDDYAFALDGGPPRPDPRSPWQPAGIHGPSRLVDHAGFEWSDATWRGTSLAGAILYELHVGTFTPAGTFDAVIDRLPELVGLGVTAIELMPVAEFPGERGWGYDGVDLFAPHHAYGGPDGLKRLVDACHAHGLGVVLDVVYNHLGPAGNYLREFGPYFTDRHATPWGEAVNLDGPDSDPVRAFVVDNASMWLRDYHVDGLRLDAVHAIVDTSAVHLLEALSERVDALEAQLGRSLFLIAESDLNDPRIVCPREVGGYGMDAQWSDDFHHALHAVLTGERGGYYADFGALADVAAALTRVFVNDGRYSGFRRRRFGRPVRGLPGWRFLGYLQNHDQIGNRAAGERMSMLVSPGRCAIGAALVLTSPFVPLLFQGEEWGARTPFLYFTDHHDPQLARAVSDGRRREFAHFGWQPEDVPDPQARDTFVRSRLDWSERARAPHADLLAWYRALIRLRRAHPALADGRIDAVGVRFDESVPWLVVERGPITVACNLGREAALVPLRDHRPATVLLASQPASYVSGGMLHVAPESVLIVG